jgi:hypothetical protein
MKLIFFLILLIQIQAQALETSYIKIQEPKGWNCTQNESLWICRSQDKIEMKESFLIVKAKLAGRGDDLNSFTESLNSPMPTSTGGAFSKVYFVKKTQGGGVDWVYGQHLHSVIPNYFTNYLVTVVGDLAIGIELNYHQSKYKKYEFTMNDIINSIQFVDNIAAKNTKIIDTGSSIQKPDSSKNMISPIEKSHQFSDSENTENKWSQFVDPKYHKIIYLAVGLIIITASLFFLR